MKNLYLTAILPPDPLSTEIDNVRKECAARFDVKAALKPPVHITLFRPIKLEDDREFELVGALDKLKNNHAAFEVTLKGFAAFRQHVVFINVVRSDALRKLADDIRIEYYHYKLALANANDHKDFRPHITIAYRDIPAWVFPELWSHYKNKEYRANFIVGAFTLLKHDGSKWMPHKTFKLGT